MAGIYFPSYVLDPAALTPGLPRVLPDLLAALYGILFAILGLATWRSARTSLSQLSLPRYVYFHLLRPQLLESGVPNLWAFLFASLITHLTTFILLFLLMRREIGVLTPSRVTDFLTLNRFNWRDLIIALSFFLLGGIVVAVLAAVIRPEMEAPLRRAEVTGASAVVYLVLLLWTSLAEESYFRAFLMRKLAVFGQMDWVLNTIVFTAYHWYALQPITATLASVVPAGLVFAFLFK